MDIMDIMDITDVGSMLSTILPSSGSTSRLAFFPLKERPLPLVAL